jgi:mannose-6-phosphate isomerase-like protein (cupin superfamily)
MPTCIRSSSSSMASARQPRSPAGSTQCRRKYGHVTGRRRTQLSWGGNVWFNGADGERQAIRVDSRDTHGAYSVIESVAEPGCAVPTHRHRNEEEHFLVISGRYRIAIGDQILDAPPGTRATVPRNTPHSWRNIAAEESQLLAILTPGGFEQIIHAVKDTPTEKIRDLAEGFGCDILGPPVAE